MKTVDRQKRHLVAGGGFDHYLLNEEFWRYKTPLYISPLYLSFNVAKQFK